MSLDTLLDGYQVCEDRGLLWSEPQPQTQNQENSELGIAVKRLFLLGYLPEDKSRYRPRLDKGDLRHAFAAFQENAGITIDGEPGPETFDALQTATAFERQDALSEWAEDELKRDLLRRAMHLRLHAYGFVVKLPRKIKNHDRRKVDDRDFFKGLEKFLHVAWMLQIADEIHESIISPQVVGLLFEFDAISEKLADMKGDTIAFRCEDGISRKKRKNNKTAVFDFVQTIARIELWLTGYDTAPSKYFSENKLSLEEAVSEFLKDLGSKRRRARNKPDILNGTLFRQLLKVRQSTEEEVTDEHVSETLDAIVKDKKIERQVKAQVEKLSSRFIDGIKRAWAWFKLIGQKIKRGIKRLARNLGRLVKSYASGVYRSISVVIKSTRRSLSHLFKGTVHGSRVDEVYMVHDKDFDYNVFVNRSASRRYVAAFLYHLSLTSTLFHRTSRIMAALLKFFINLAKRTLTASWFGALLSLVRMKSRLSNFTARIRTIRDLVTRLELIEHRLQEF